MRCLTLTSVAIFTLSARGQGSFQNLDFEAANVSQIQPPGMVNTTNALPGWTVSFGYGPTGNSRIQQDQVAFNSLDPWIPQAILVGTNGTGTGVFPIQGDFGVLLQAMNMPGYQWHDVSISQTAIVPTNAQSILFEAQPGAETFLVSMNSQNIPYEAMTTGANYTLYGGDISAFAGQSAELEMSVLVPFSDPSGWNIDSIGFSTQPVPEPSTFALGGLALGLMVIIGMRNRAKMANKMANKPSGNRRFQ
jgi:hypothetical protein